jgi:hypothetical protein
MGPRRRAVALLAAAVLLGACSGSGPGTPPAAFENRSPLPDCGSVVVDQGEPIELPADVADCLARPDGGEALLQAPTAEGDPVRSHYRVGPGIQGVELFVDSTDDRLGSQEWTRQSCPGATPADIGAPSVLACDEPEVMT